MARFTLGRRTVLRGAAGVAIALPPLEIMGARQVRGAACAIPNRFLTAFAGISHGGGNPAGNPNGPTVEQALVVPKTSGKDWVLTRGFAPIGGGKVSEGTKQEESYPSVKPYVGVVSGLRIPWATGSGPVPPAGRGNPVTVGFHGTSMRSQFSGERETGSQEDTPPQGSTADQLVATAIGGTTPFRSVALQVQAAASYQNYCLSYTRGRRNSPTISPRQAYNKLFGGGAVNGKTFDVAAFIDRRKSVLDVVLGKSQALSRRLGGEDKRRLDRYYTEIRGLEASLDALKMTSGTMMCKPPSEPTDPAIGGDLDGNFDKETQLYTSADAAWSNEELRAQLMCDFVHLAFACDLTHSVALTFTEAQSYLNTYHILSARKTRDMHGVVHGATIEEIADLLAWHVKHFSRLASKLHDTVECDGSRVLDHCAMVMVLEGGHGALGDGTSIWSSHSTENMIAVVAGGAGGLKSGQHIHYDNDKHPGQVVLTHMNAVGVPDGQPLGEITEPLPELLRLS